MRGPNPAPNALSEGLYTHGSWSVIALWKLNVVQEPEHVRYSKIMLYFFDPSLHFSSIVSKLV